MSSVESSNVQLDVDSPDVCFLGLDLSTQQLKGVILDKNLEILNWESVNFDQDLPEFCTKGGVNDKGNGHVTSNVLMWVKALDMLMAKFQATESLKNVVMVSGCAQQHGSVWWKDGSAQVLEGLQPDQPLHLQLKDSFTTLDTPIWMDSTTTRECDRLEQAVGGKMTLLKLTGSRAHERFTGNQIARLFELNRGAYEATERIALVSSFLCSLFLGRYAPIDYADGSGMNLLNINTKDWSDDCLEGCSPGLRKRLGAPVETGSVLGPVSDYFLSRYQLHPTCRVVTFTGDNPASLLGLHLGVDDIAVSLGTSDTVFMTFLFPLLESNSHVFISPSDAAQYMSMLCFKNGSLARERLRDELADGSWDRFNAMLAEAPRGNNGEIGLFYDKREIKPFLQGTFLFDATGTQVDRLSSTEVEVRALVEGQFMAMRSLLHDLGVQLHEGSGCLRKYQIVATGGASTNDAILQVLSDVLNLPVFRQEQSEHSACVGAAAQGKMKVCSGSGERVAPHRQLVCEPHRDAHQIYDSMMEKYRVLIKRLEDSLL